MIRCIRFGFKVAIYSFLIWITACSGNFSDPCPPDNYIPTEYYMTGIARAEVYQRLANGDLLPVNENSPVPIEQIEFLVDFRFEARTRQQQSTSSRILNWLIKPAYPCSPFEPIVSSVVGMGLISNASLGASFPPGASLSRAYFAEATNAYNTYESNFNAESRQLSEYSVSDPTGLAGAYIIRSYLSVDAAGLNPDATELHRFAYSVELATGQIFEVDFPSVLIGGS